jgi:hypothetical protein
MPKNVMWLFDDTIAARFLRLPNHPLQRFMPNLKACPAQLTDQMMMIFQAIS